MLRARLTARPRRAGLLLSPLRALCSPRAGGVAAAAAAAPRSWGAAGPLLRDAAAGDAADAAESEDAAVGALAGAAREPEVGRAWLQGLLCACAERQEKDCGRRPQSTRRALPWRTMERRAHAQATRLAATRALQFSAVPKSAEARGIAAGVAHLAAALGRAGGGALLGALAAALMGALGGPPAGGRAAPPGAPLGAALAGGACLALPGVALAALRAGGASDADVERCAAALARVCAGPRPTGRLDGWLAGAAGQALGGLVAAALSAGVELGARACSGNDPNPNPGLARCSGGLAPLAAAAAAVGALARAAGTAGALPGAGDAKAGAAAGLAALLGARGLLPGLPDGVAGPGGAPVTAWLLADQARAAPARDALQARPPGRGRALHARSP